MRLKPLANERPPRAHAEGASRRGGIVKRGERHGFGFFGLNSAPLLPWCVILGDVCSFGAPSPRLPRTDDNTSPSQASGGKGETPREVLGAKKGLTDAAACPWSLETSQDEDAMPSDTDYLQPG